MEANILTAKKGDFRIAIHKLEVTYVIKKFILHQIYHSNLFFS